MSLTTNRTETAGRTTRTTTAGRRRWSTRDLLTAGAVAGPAFAAVAAAQVLTREGFDLTRHPISSLSTGDAGVVQIVNFTVFGVLMLGLAAGIRRTITEGRGRTWIARMIAVFGIGFIGAGVFVADPENGFPPGTPAGVPESMSWHAMAHSMFAVVAFNALTIACVILAVRLAGQRRRGWAAISGLTAILLVAIPSTAAQDGMSIRLAVASAVAFAWTTGVAMWLRRRTSTPTARQS